MNQPSLGDGRRTLSVFLDRALDLRSMDFFKNQDPYCKLRCGNKEEKSLKISSGGKHPVWNQTFIFKVGPTDNELYIEIWDADKYTADDLIGRTRIDLSQLRLTGKAKVSAPVYTKKNKQQGVLMLDLEFKDKPQQHHGTPSGVHAQHSGHHPPHHVPPDLARQSPASSTAWSQGAPAPSQVGRPSLSHVSHSADTYASAAGDYRPFGINTADPATIEELRAQLARLTQTRDRKKQHLMHNYMILQQYANSHDAHRRSWYNELRQTYEHTQYELQTLDKEIVQVQERLQRKLQEQRQQQQQHAQCPPRTSAHPQHHAPPPGGMPTWDSLPGPTSTHGHGPQPAGSPASSSSVDMYRPMSSVAPPLSVHMPSGNQGFSQAQPLPHTTAHTSHMPAPGDRHAGRQSSDHYMQADGSMGHGGSGRTSGAAGQVGWVESLRNSCASDSSRTARSSWGEDPRVSTLTQAVLGIGSIDQSTGPGVSGRADGHADLELLSNRYNPAATALQGGGPPVYSPAGQRHDRESERRYGAQQAGSRYDVDPGHGADALKDRVRQPRQQQGGSWGHHSGVGQPGAAATSQDTRAQQEGMQLGAPRHQRTGSSASSQDGSASGHGYQHAGRQDATAQRLGASAGMAGGDPYTAWPEGHRRPSSGSDQQAGRQDAKLRDEAGTHRTSSSISNSGYRPVVVIGANYPNYASPEVMAKRVRAIQRWKRFVRFVVVNLHALKLDGAATIVVETRKPAPPPPPPPPPQKPRPPAPKPKPARGKSTPGDTPGTSPTKPAGANMAAAGVLAGAAGAAAGASHHPRSTHAAPTQGHHSADDSHEEEEEEEGEGGDKIMRDAEFLGNVRMVRDPGGRRASRERQGRPGDPGFVPPPMTGRDAVDHNMNFVEEIKRRGNHQAQVEADVLKHGEAIRKMAAKIEADRSQSMAAMCGLVDEVNKQLDVLVDVPAVLKHFPEWPEGRFDAMQDAADMYRRRLGGKLRDMINWQVPASAQSAMVQSRLLIDGVRIYLDRIAAEKGTMEKRYSTYHLPWDPTIWDQVNSAALEVCKKQLEATLKAVQQPTDLDAKQCIDLLQNTLDLSFRVYQMVGGHNRAVQQLSKQAFAVWGELTKANEEQ